MMGEVGEVGEQEEIDVVALMLDRDFSSRHAFPWDRVKNKTGIGNVG